MNLGKSTRFDVEQILVSFDDIAGIDEKAEFEEIVSLKEPERYTLVGAKIPKGYY
jgi:ATP-dependent Zn protease